MENKTAPENAVAKISKIKEELGKYGLKLKDLDKVITPESTLCDILGKYSYYLHIQTVKMTLRECKSEEDLMRYKFVGKKKAQRINCILMLNGFHLGE